MTTDVVYHGPINPGHPVTCETPGCGAEYVPMSYECVPQDCPRCGQ